MKTLATIVALATVAFCGVGNAADLPTTKAPGAPDKPVCWSSLWTVLKTSSTDCPIGAYGVTFYGVFDMGAGYNTAGVPFNNSHANGVYYAIGRNANEGRWSLFPSAVSTSAIGVRMEEKLNYGDWRLIGAVEMGYNPQSFVVVNGPRSLTDNNLNKQAYQTANGDSSRAGQWNNSVGFVGLSSATFGSLTFGRQNSLSNSVVGAYDGAASNAYSLLGWSSSISALGLSELARVNTAFVYRWSNENFRIAGLSQVGNGYALGNGSMGQYQVQLGATWGGFSIDAVGSWAKDGVSLSSFGGSPPDGYNPNTVVRATLSNNVSFLVATRYKWDVFEVYGGYVYTRFSNPSDSFENGFKTIALGICVPPGLVNSTSYGVNRIQNTGWVSGKWNILSNLSVGSTIVYQAQNNYQPAGAYCTGYSTGISSSKCAGAQLAYGGMLIWKPVRRVDVYAGAMVSNVYGGMASGYFKAQDINPSAGIRIRF